MKQLILIAPALLLSACAEPMIKDSDVVRTAMDPIYTYNEGGVVIPSSCQPGRASTYSGVPSRCSQDVALARQVLNPNDMVDPIAPGPAQTGPIGRAADDYLYGGQQAPGGGFGATGGGMRGSPRTLYPDGGNGAAPGAAAGGSMGGNSGMSQLPYDPYATGR